MNKSKKQIQLQLTDLIRNIIVDKDSFLYIGLQTKLNQDLNFDSLSTMSLLISVEKTFAIKIIGASPESLITLQDWRDLIIRQFDMEQGKINIVSPDVSLLTYSTPNEILPCELEKIYSQSTVFKKVVRFFLQNTLYLFSLVSKSLIKLLVKKLYSTPSSMKKNEWEFDILAEAKTKIIEIDHVKVHYYCWGTGPCVILCHGWSGHASQLGMLVKPITDAGYQVIAIDAPGHGLSSKKSINWQSYAHAISVIVEHQEYVAAMVGHCMGGVCVTRALQRINKTIGKVILINSFDNFSWLADLYCKTLGINNALVKSVFETSDRAYSRSFPQSPFSCRSTLEGIDCECLIVHDLDDDFVPFRHGEYISSIKNAKLHSTNGLGHSLILVHKPTITAITQFILK